MYIHIYNHEVPHKQVLIYLKSFPAYLYALNLDFDSHFDLNFDSGTAVSCHNTTCPAKCVYLEEKYEEGKRVI